MKQNVKVTFLAPDGSMIDCVELASVPPIATIRVEDIMAEPNNAPRIESDPATDLRARKLYLKLEIESRRRACNKIEAKHNDQIRQHQNAIDTLKKYRDEKTFALRVEIQELEESLADLQE